MDSLSDTNSILSNSTINAKHNENDSLTCNISNCSAETITDAFVATLLNENSNNTNVRTDLDAVKDSQQNIDRISGKNDNILECHTSAECSVTSTLNSLMIKISEKELLVDKVSSTDKRNISNSSTESINDAFVVTLLNENSSDANVGTGSETRASQQNTDRIGSKIDNINYSSVSFSVNDTLNSLVTKISNNELQVDKDSSNTGHELNSSSIAKELTELNGAVEDESLRSASKSAIQSIEPCVQEITCDILYRVETAQMSPVEEKNDKNSHSNINSHRESEMWTDDESCSSTSSSSSSDSDTFLEELHKSSTPKPIPNKLKGEIDLEDLPPIEELTISVNEDELMKIGKIHAIVNKQVVVQALKNQKPLDEESVLFLASDKPLGRIFEVFGPVIEPFYVVLFNSPEDVERKGIIVDSDVYFAPKKTDITSYVFVDILRQQKGSDASWKDNNEPPEEHLDYSDDEQERAAKLKWRAKRRARDEDNDVQIISNKCPTVAKVKPVSVVDSGRNNSFSNQNNEKFSGQRNPFQPNITKNIFRKPFTSETTPSRTFDSEINKFSSSRLSAVPSTTSLDNVPVWITSPPAYFETRPLPSPQQNISSTPSPHQSFSTPQPAVVSHLQPMEQPRSANTYPLQHNPSQPLFRSSPLFLYPKQPFIARQPPNFNNPPIVYQSQSPLSAHRFSGNFHPNSQPLMPQHPQQTHLPRPVVLQNSNQPHIFGQMSAVRFVSPVPSFSTPMYSPCPSPTVFVSQSSPVPANYFASSSPAPGPANADNSHWQNKEQFQSQYSNVQNNPLRSPLSVQIPTFANLPPLVRFNASSDCAIPPPKPPPTNFASQAYGPPQFRY